MTGRQPETREHAIHSSPASQKTPRPATRYALVGAALIAISFGLARFAFGLFVPGMRDTLALSPDVVGLVAAQAYVGFIVASLFAAAAVERLGVRRAAMAAGISLCLGLSLIGTAGGAWTLGAGVFACGIGTGMMMPALSAGLTLAVRPAVHGRVNAIMNAGTSIGIALSVPTVVLFSDAWRHTYLGFALVAALGVLLAGRALPAGQSGKDKPQQQRLAPAQRARLWRLLLFAFGMGLVSAIYWVFTPDLTVALGKLTPSLTGWLWFAVGLAGLGGALAGDLMDRFGPARSQGAALLVLAGALLLVAMAPGQLLVALLSAALFGLAYMALSGIYLVAGVRLLEQRPALGPVLPFLATTVGQAAGSPLAGAAVAEWGYQPAFIGFAAAGLALACLFSGFPDQGTRR